MIAYFGMRGGVFNTTSTQKLRNGLCRTNRINLLILPLLFLRLIASHEKGLRGAGAPGSNILN
jgi:hypothetical protein